MQIALLADIHANVSALGAVLEDVARRRPDYIACLGDLVGYNAEPAQVIEIIARAADFIVAGNHDREVVGPITGGTTSAARRALTWTRDALSDEARHYLSELPGRIVAPNQAFVAVHGCYLNETYVSGYVTETMLPKNLAVLAGRADDLSAVGFCGHTHIPMLAYLDGEVHHRAGATQLQWSRRAQAVLINPGSVGQPRDGDPRAAYAIVDLEERWARVHRVPYDITRAVEALARAGLPDELGKRLLEGR